MIKEIINKENLDKLFEDEKKEEIEMKEANDKRKHKKWRKKINKIAKAENITPEEVLERF